MFRPKESYKENSKCMIGEITQRSKPADIKKTLGGRKKILLYTFSLFHTFTGIEISTVLLTAELFTYLLLFQLYIKCRCHCHPAMFLLLDINACQNHRYLFLFFSALVYFQKLESNFQRNVYEDFIN